MKKQDIIIVAALSIALLFWLRHQSQLMRHDMSAAREAALAKALDPASGTALAPVHATNNAPVAFAAAPSASEGTIVPVAQSDAAGEVADKAPILPEQTLVLTNDHMRLTLSSKGGALRDATLPEYRSAIDHGSSPVVLDFFPSPALALQGLPGFGVGDDFELVENTSTSATLRCTSEPGSLTLERRVEILPDYRVNIRDSLINPGETAYALPVHVLSLGAVRRGLSKSDTLGVDALGVQPDGRGRAPKVQHWDTRLNGLFTGGRGGGGRGGGGCGGAPQAAGLPPSASTEVAEPQEWIALKSRFFVQAFQSDAANSGYQVSVTRQDGDGPLSLDNVAAQVRFAGATIAPGATLERNYSLYIGPKKLSLLKDFGNRTAEIMQFGFFRWFCVLLVPALNFFYAIIPNYGVAIILLTMLVRILFWPLTHKSTEGMKRMQAAQPLLKEIQAKFKNDPKKLQQETMKVYSENKINPLSSCLPMLIQIPVFIALFTVLRSAVELRFAPFLWIADLSEPENLLPGVLPFVSGLNILPFLMSGTMVLQTKLSPSAGDPTQQKMMMVMMPLMMLFMFYSMPSALLLYWTVSQILAIVQILWQRKRAAAKAADNAPPSGGDDRPLTRQARRRLSR